MGSLDDLKQQFKDGYAKQQQVDAALRENPALANMPEMKKRARGIGLVTLLVVCVPLTLINYLGYTATERFIVILLAANIVLPPLAIYMLVTGKNPMQKKK